VKYLIDANVFIQAKNCHYGMDFCPAFWDWMIKMNDSGVLASIGAVSDELAPFNDELTQWSLNRNNTFFLDPNERVIAAASNIAEWVDAQPYRFAAKDKFFDSTDHILVAYALSIGCTVVTHEKKADSKSKRKIKIPNVCCAFDVDYITPFQMLRRERARFVLDPKS